MICLLLLDSGFLLLASPGVAFFYFSFISEAGLLVVMVVMVVMVVGVVMVLHSHFSTLISHLPKVSKSQSPEGPGVAFFLLLFHQRSRIAGCHGCYGFTLSLLNSHFSSSQSLKVSKSRRSRR
ncbi:MAG: hypothetical protein K9N40_03605, partial [Candidatus Cloacimonetes bacterium]|nr:hypothetical protein [Candidatus Cloacimonadota bacterium]